MGKKPKPGGHPASQAAAKLENQLEFQSPSTQVKGATAGIEYAWDICQTSESFIDDPPSDFDSEGLVPAEALAECFRLQGLWGRLAGQYLPRALVVNLQEGLPDDLPSWQSFQDITQAAADIHPAFPLMYIDHLGDTGRPLVIHSDRGAFSAIGSLVLDTQDYLLILPFGQPGENAGDEIEGDLPFPPVVFVRGEAPTVDGAIMIGQDAEAPPDLDGANPVLNSFFICSMMCAEMITGVLAHLQSVTFAASDQDVDADGASSSDV